MPRRKKRFLQLNLKPDSTRSLIALLLMLFGILSLLSLVGHISQFENSLYELLQRYVGTAAFFLPFVLVSAGLALTKLTWRIARSRVFWGLFVFQFGLIALFHVLFNGDNTAAIAQAGEAGGLIGLFVGGALIRVFSVFGAFLIAIALLFIGILILFNTSLEEMGEWGGKYVAPALRKGVSVASSLRNRRVEEEVVAAEEAVPMKINKPKNDMVEIVEDAPVPRASHDHEHGTQAELPGIPEYEPPSLSLLSDAKEIAADRGDVEKNAMVIEKTLDSFGVQARVAEVNLGPAVTQYALNLSEGTKITKITSLQNDLALALAAPTGAVRIEAPIPGKKLVGVEVPNYTSTLVTMRNSLLSDQMQESKAKLSVVLGQNVAGEVEVADLTKWPHVLIAGATGAGKSVLVHSLIISILYTRRPDEVQFMFIDPKRVELTQYDGIPHLLRSVIVDADKAVNAFKWAVHEMEHRYKLFQQIPGARDLASFNEVTDTPKLPYIVIVVDEMADLMAYAKNEAEGLITRLAQMSRATGIHLVLATQRPSVDVITGLIKANIPTRIALNVTSITDSRVILDSGGADKLIGKGDMLYLPPDAAKPRRIQGVFVSDEELRNVIGHLKKFAKPRIQADEAADLAGAVSGEPAVPGTTEDEWHGGVTASTRDPDFDQPDDNKFDEAVREIMSHDRASASLLQRRLKIGYARAARLLDELEERGIVSPPDGSNPREVYKDKARAYFEHAGQGDTEDPFYD